MHYAYFCVGFTFLITVCSGFCSNPFVLSEPRLLGGEGCILDTHIRKDPAPDPTSYLTPGVGTGDPWRQSLSWLLQGFAQVVVSMGSQSGGGMLDSRVKGNVRAGCVALPWGCLLSVCFLLSPMSFCLPVRLCGHHSPPPSLLGTPPWTKTANRYFFLQMYLL